MHALTRTRDLLCKSQTLTLFLVAKVDDENLSMVLSGQNEEPFSCSGGHIGMVVGFRVLKTIVSASIFL
jgi:hypothetical protein